MSSDDITDSRDESPEQPGGDRSLARPAVDVSGTGLSSGDNDLSTFDPGDIISDAVFNDSQAIAQVDRGGDANPLPRETVITR